jgi:hypothetical protein
MRFDLREGDVRIGAVSGEKKMPDREIGGFTLRISQRGSSP